MKDVDTCSEDCHSPSSSDRCSSVLLRLSVNSSIHCEAAMTTASVTYISASTNRYNHAADVSPDSLVAFGSSKLVALWDTSVCFSRSKQ